MKKILVLLVLLAVVACSGNNSKETPKNEKKILVVDNFFDQASSLIDKEIKITGTVVHTCAHGGKRAHIIGKNPDVKLKLEVAENGKVFNKELEGSEIVVTGVVRQLLITKDYLDKWEKDIKAQGVSDKNLHDGHSKENANMSEQEENLAKITNYRKMLEEDKTDKLEFYSVECTSYEVKK